MQHKGKYASKEEISEDKERIKEKRRVKGGNFRNQER